MKLTPPTEIPKLARDLGIQAPQLRKLRIKHKGDEKLRPILQRWWRETRDIPQYLHRHATASTPDYVNTSAMAMKGELGAEEVILARYQNVVSVQAHSRFAERQRTEQAEDVARENAKRVAGRLRTVLVDAARLGVDPTERLARIERELGELQGQAERQRAA